MLLLRVIRCIPALQSIYPLLADAGYLLFAAKVAQVGDNRNQSASAHASQVFIPFDKNRIRAAPGCRQSRPDTSRAAADNHNIRCPTDARMPGSFADCLARSFGGRLF